LASPNKNFAVVMQVKCCSTFVPR